MNYQGIIGSGDRFSTSTHQKTIFGLFFKDVDNVSICVCKPPMEKHNIIFGRGVSNHKLPSQESVIAHQFSHHIRMFLHLQGLHESHILLQLDQPQGYLYFNQINTTLLSEDIASPIEISTMFCTNEIKNLVERVYSCQGLKPMDLESNVFDY